MTDNNAKATTTVDNIMDNLRAKPDFIAFRDNLRKSVVEALGDNINKTVDDAMSEIFTKLATEALAEPISKVILESADKILVSDRILLKSLQESNLFPTHLVENLNLDVEKSESVLNAIALIEDQNLDNDSLIHLLTLYNNQIDQFIASLESVLLQMQGDEKAKLLTALCEFMNTKLDAIKSFVELLISNQAVTKHWIENNKQPLISIMGKIAATVEMSKITFGLLVALGKETDATKPS